MKSSEAQLLKKIQDFTSKGKSMKIEENERKDAEALVKAEKCYWSIDYDHISSYDMS